MPDEASLGHRPPNTPAEPTTFSPELVELTRDRLRDFLGPTWGLIEGGDAPTLAARDRHLLALLDESSRSFGEEYRSGRLPGHMPDFLALLAITDIFGRMRADEVFEDLRPSLADRGNFRHAMLTLGLADHIRRYTPYPVRLPARGPTGVRLVDLVVGSTFELDIETKSAKEFEGPVRTVSRKNALDGIRKAWRRAFGGAVPQLHPDRATALLVGGVTIDHSSMPTIQAAARNWLSWRGDEQRNFWGILVMTFLTYTVVPAGRAFGDGKPLTLTAHATPYLVGANNPHYRGDVRLVLTPSSDGPFPLP